MKKKPVAGFRCYVCGEVFPDQTERATPCGYERFGQATCKACCEKCHALEPFPCPQYNTRKRREKKGGPKSMTWKEAKEAFADNAAVIYHNRLVCPTPIECPRIAEITLHRRQDGQIVQIVGAMDKNENCIYRDTPDKFTRR